MEKEMGQAAERFRLSQRWLRKWIAQRWIGFVRWLRLGHMQDNRERIEILHHVHRPRQDNTKPHGTPWVETPDGKLFRTIYVPAGMSVEEARRILGSPADCIFIQGMWQPLTTILVRVGVCPMSEIVFLVLAALGFLYYLAVEALDWAGRIEYMKTHYPGWVDWAQRRKLRVGLLLLVALLLGHAIYDLERHVEAKDSLRRRTVELAEKLDAFTNERARNQPTYATNETTPEEQAAARRRANSYYDETNRIYMERFKDRTMGIIQELKEKGLKVGIIELGAPQRIPTPDEIQHLRDLAHYLDEKGDVIQF